MPPAARMVPPVGGLMVSGQRTGDAVSTVRSNVALHVRGPVIAVRPVGAQSPVKPLKENPSSGSALSSTASPSRWVVEQSDPRVPHLMPALEIVPPTGVVIVSR